MINMTNSEDSRLPGGSVAPGASLESVGKSADPGTRTSSKKGKNGKSKKNGPFLESAKIRISDLHGTLQTFEKKSVRPAWEIGQMLSNVKSAVGHGNFMKWREEHLPQIDQATQNRYLSFYENYSSEGELEELIESGMGLTEIYARIADRRGRSKKGKGCKPTSLATSNTTGGGPNRVHQFINHFDSLVEETRSVVSELPVTEWGEQDQARLIRAFTELGNLVNPLLSNAEVSNS